MSVVATLEHPTEQFPLQSTLASVPGLEIEAESVAAHGTDRLLAFVWMRCDDWGALDQALATDHTLTDAALLKEQGERRLYRLDWAEGFEPVARLLDDEGATIMNASARNDAWTFRILFPHRDSLSRTLRVTEQEAAGFSVQRIREFDTARNGSDVDDTFGLTASQREALRVALDGGYYQVPRGAELSELAGDLNISHQALSERLRRAHGHLAAYAVEQFGP